MKTVVILLSFTVNTNGVVHKAVYETTFERCYEAERVALAKALEDYIDTNKAERISIESCNDTKSEPNSWLNNEAAAVVSL